MRTSYESGYIKYNNNNEKKAHPFMIKYKFKRGFTGFIYILVGQLITRFNNILDKIFHIYRYVFLLFIKSILYTLNEDEMIQITLMLFICSFFISWGRGWVEVCFLWILGF